MSALGFEVLHTSPASHARACRIELARGAVETPVFMPVGTLGTVKAVSPHELEELGAEIVLANTYHLMLRPGANVVEKLGGLHGFMAWQRPILTDSGGFQVWSLGALRKIEEDGVRFQSHIDGAEVFLGPRESMRVQRQLGSDIVMAFDECTPYPATIEQAAASMQLSMRWEMQCRELLPEGRGQALFGIVQGGVYPELRLESLKAIESMGMEGVAIGGLSVGETKDEMLTILDALAPHLPEDKPRYLMGVGTPADLINGIDRGIDMFDCVMPTRNARNGTLFTNTGPIHIKQAQYREDPEPIMNDCECYACKHFSCAYLRHLYVNREILGARLNTMHNLHYYLALMRRARTALRQDLWPQFRDQFLRIYHNGCPTSGDTST